MTTDANYTILVVEDEPFVLMLLTDFLGDLRYEVLSARDARMALGIIESGKEIDLLLTDVGLPGLNGWALAEAARALRPSLPIIFATGYGEDNQAKSQALARRAAVASKPFDMDRLADLVRTMIEKAEG
jgi:CheY-like chemotaxis protein